MNVDNNSGARQGSFPKLAPDDETDENEKTNPPAEDDVDKKDVKVPAGKRNAESRTVKGSSAELTPDENENKTYRLASTTGYCRREEGRETAGQQRIFHISSRQRDST